MRRRSNICTHELTHTVLQLPKPTHFTTADKNHRRGARGVCAEVLLWPVYPCAAVWTALCLHRKISPGMHVHKYFYRMQRSTSVACVSVCCPSDCSVSSSKDSSRYASTVVFLQNVEKHFSGLCIYVSLFCLLCVFIEKILLVCARRSTSVEFREVLLRCVLTRGYTNVQVGVHVCA